MEVSTRNRCQSGAYYEKMGNVRARKIGLGLALGLAVVALRYRSSVQVWASGVGQDARQLVGRPAPALPPPVARAVVGGAGPNGAGGRLPAVPVDLAALRGRVVLLHFWTFG